MVDQSFQRDRRLRKSSDFQLLRERGISRAHPLLILRAARNELPYSRFGFIVGRRVAAKAVIRNRLRRRLREIVRRASVQGGWDVLLIARKAAIEEQYETLQEAVLELVRRAGLRESCSVDAARLAAEA